MKANKSIDYYKTIASKVLIDMYGEDWIKENSSKLCSFISDEDRQVQVTFAFVESLPSEIAVMDEKDIKFQPDNSISFIISKSDDKCIVHRNLL